MSTATRERPGALRAADGVPLHYRTWPAAAERAVLLVSHGLGEHGGRYAALAEDLAELGVTVHAVDHRGHGRTANGRLGDFGAAGFPGLIADVAQFGKVLRAHLRKFVGKSGMSGRQRFDFFVSCLQWFDGVYTVVIAAAGDCGTWTCCCGRTRWRCDAVRRSTRWSWWGTGPTPRHCCRRTITAACGASSPTRRGRR